MVFNNITVVTWTAWKLSKYIGFYLIFFIKCTGNTVCIDVAAKKHWYEGLFFKFHIYNPPIISIVIPALFYTRCVIYTSSFPGKNYVIVRQKTHVVDTKKQI